MSDFNSRPSTLDNTRSSRHGAANSESHGRVGNHEGQATISDAASISKHQDAPEPDHGHRLGLSEEFGLSGASRWSKRDNDRCRGNAVDDKLRCKNTVSFPVAEIHHLVWSIALDIGLRPSSFGPKKVSCDAPPYLTWGDVSFRLIRTPLKGHFSVEIRVRNLKGTKRQGSTAPQKITFDLCSPSQLTNLVLSVPHRLLVIAPRRGILAGILTTDGLLDGQLTFMIVRDEHS